MNANKALWEKGDFTQIARFMRGSGEALAESFGITPGMRVLDLGCGDGTTAVPAARLAREVVGIDIAANLVAAAKARAAEEGLTNLRFEEGDAADLVNVADESFDQVVSIFGAMFAPRPDDVAREMVRVTRPGGRIIMGNWIPGDPTLVAQVLRISAAHTPPPPEGFVSPMRWGVERDVVERFAGAGIAEGDITLERESFVMTFPGPPGAMLQTFIDFYGPTMTAFEHAARAGSADRLKAELTELFEAQNRSRSDAVTEIAATYLRVTVAVP